MEDIFTATMPNHPPSSFRRLSRVLLSLGVGTGLGWLLGWAAGIWLSGFLDGRGLWPIGLVSGLIAGVGVGIGLARFDQLTPGLVLGLMGYVILGMVGYACLFGLVGLFVAGAAGFQWGAALGAVVGTAVGLTACLIKYRYRHF